MKDLEPAKTKAIKTFFPKNCHECPFCERNKEVEELYQCNYYKRSYCGYPGVKPPFCKVEAIGVSEKDQDKQGG
jgi:hypothetical protein